MTKEEMAIVHLIAHNDGRVGLCDENRQYAIIYPKGTFGSSHGWTIGSIARSGVVNRLGFNESLHFDKHGQPKL